MTSLQSLSNLDEKIISLQEEKAQSEKIFVEMGETIQSCILNSRKEKNRQKEINKQLIALRKKRILLNDQLKYPYLMNIMHNNITSLDIKSFNEAWIKNKKRGKAHSIAKKKLIKLCVKMAIKHKWDYGYREDNKLSKKHRHKYVVYVDCILGQLSFHTTEKIIKILKLPVYNSEWNRKDNTWDIVEKLVELNYLNI